MASRTDNFNRSEDPVVNPSDGGSAWAGAGNFGCNGSVLYNNVGNNKWLESSVTDHKAGVNVVTGNTSSGLIARVVDNNNYYLFVKTSGASELYSVVSSSFSLLGTGGAIANGDTIELECVGTSIKAYINGVQTVSVTDSSLTTGTKAGVYGGLTYDDFSITDLSGGGGGGQDAPELDGRPGPLQWSRLTNQLLAY